MYSVLCTTVQVHACTPGFLYKYLRDLDIISALTIDEIISLAHISTGTQPG